MKLVFRDIKIDHLGYVIKIKDIKKHPRKNYVMYVERLNSNSCSLVTKRNITISDIPTLAHEVVHILQYIAEARNIDLIYEQENTGYLTQFIFNKLLGFEYK